MTTTDTPKRLSDDEVAAQFLALEVFLGDVDGHDMTDWTTDEYGEMRGVDEGTIDASSAVEAMNAIRSHIAAITAPPSQGKVERAREISHNIVSYCRECSFNLDVLKYTREEAEEYVTSAITQALTESSGQVTDGACCEALREKAAVIAEDKSFEGFSISTAPDLESIATVREVEVREAIANSIRALPVSADGRDAVIEECAQICDAEFRLRKSRLDNPDPNFGDPNIQGHKSVTALKLAEKLRALKSKQPSDTKPICSTYHSRAVGVACTNCGHPKAAHGEQPSDTGAGK